MIAEDVLTGRKKISGSVIIIGGGLVGCETAEYLMEQGQNVTSLVVIEMLKRMAEDISPTYRPFFLARLSKIGIQMKTGTIVEEITKEGVKVNQQGTSNFINGAAVVLAVGLKSEKAFLVSFLGKAPEIHYVGDCVKPRTIKEAIEEGFRIGMEI